MDGSPHYTIGYERYSRNNSHLQRQVGQYVLRLRELKALVADVPYSNIRYAERVMLVEERYRMVITIIFRAIGCRVEVERMQAVGRPDIVVYVKNKVYVLELKLENNGGAAAAQPAREVFALGIGMDNEGKGLTAYEQVI